jgi:hypothetical protein
MWALTVISILISMMAVSNTVAVTEAKIPEQLEFPDVLPEIHNFPPRIENISCGGGNRLLKSWILSRFFLLGFTRSGDHVP